MFVRCSKVKMIFKIGINTERNVNNTFVICPNKSLTVLCHFGKIIYQSVKCTITDILPFRHFTNYFIRVPI